MNETAVALGVISDESKTHRRADGHHQRIVGHGLSKRIQRTERIHGDQAKHKASREEHKTRFQAFDQGIHRQNRNGNCQPFKQRHVEIPCKRLKNTRNCRS